MIDMGDEKSGFWGEVIHQYTDLDAIRDGLIVPFVVNGKDTGHRITTNAVTELMEHYGKEGSEEGEGFIAFILCELLPLVPFAVRKWESGGILETDFDFRVGKSGGRNRLWFIPNERGGITVMKPEDY